MTELANRTLLDLTHALACHLQPPPHFLQGMVLVIQQTKAQLNHLTLAQRQIIEDTPHLLTQQMASCRLDWTYCALIFKNIAQRILFLIRERGIQREDFLGPDQQLTHPIWRHTQRRANRVRRWL